MTKAQAKACGYQISFQGSKKIGANPKIRPDIFLSFSEY